MTNGSPIVVVRLQTQNTCTEFEAGPNVSNVLARATPAGFVNCDGKILEGEAIAAPRQASPAEVSLFEECERESVNRLGSRAPASPKLQAVSTGKPARGAMVLRRRALEHAPTMPAGRATMAGLGAVTPESGVRPSTRYLVLGVEPEVTRVSPGAYSGRRRP